MDSTKASDNDPLDELLGVDRRAFEEDELTQVLSRSEPPPPPPPPPARDVTDERVVTEEIVVSVDESGDRPTIPGEVPLLASPERTFTSPRDRSASARSPVPHAHHLEGPAAALPPVAPVAQPPQPAGLSDEDPRDALIGNLVDGRYRVLRLLGVGGIGLVYLCRHEVLEKPVALKVLRPEYVLHEDLNERFINEARAASAIKSPHIVDTLDVGTLPSGVPYFVMEYVEGETLAALLDREGSIDLARTLDIAHQSVEGLKAAHAAGVVHRDLKPENVFVSARPDGSLMVRIFDFGIAKVARARKRLTYAGAVFGTPTYMSPEQARGEEVDQRSDLYALGIMIFEMLSGTVPFDGEEPLAIMAQHVDRAPPPLHTMSRVAIPKSLEVVVARCLAKDPKERYPSASALLDDLDAVANDSQILRPPSFAPPKQQVTLHAHVLPAAAPTRGRLGRLLWVAAAAAVVAGVGSWLVLGGRLPWPSSGVDDPSAAVAQRVAATPPAPAKPLVDPKEETTEVHFVLFPLDAHVFRGEEDLGAMPVSLHVKKGESAVVTVRRKGYMTRRAVVDGTQTRLVIGLVKQR